MAINYATLFGKLGKLVKKTNSLETLGSTTLPDDLYEIVNQFGTTDTGVSTAQLPLEGLHIAYAGLMDTVTSMRRTIAGYADSTITDYDTVVSQINGLSTTNLADVLYAVIQDMFDQAESVTRSVITIGSVTADSNNIGNGTLYIDKKLDGVTPPLAGGLSHLRYTDLDSEMAPATATHVFTCISDAYGSSNSDGSEGFSWSDGIDFGNFSSFPEGTGQGPGITVAAGSGLLSRTEFESFSANTPTGWNIINGTAGTNILQSTAQAFRGSSSLLFAGDGTDLRIRKLFPRGRLTPRRRYHVAVRLYNGSATNGSIKVYFSGTGFTPDGTEEVNVNVASLGASWTLYSFYWTTPANIPSDLEMRVEATNALNGNVYIDSLTMTPVSYHAGVNAVIIPGSIPFARGDKLTVTVTNSEGVFQRFARRHWRAQLPSQNSGTVGFAITLPLSLLTGSVAPTISDSLAT